MCFDFLPTQNNRLPVGFTPKPSKVARVIARKKAQKAEAKAIEKAVKPKKADRKQIGVKLRAMVMERDSNCCTVCGQIGTKENPLQVDHIVPVAAGGTNCESNLRTTCRDCNLGKGARRVTVRNPEAAAMNARMVDQLKELVGKKKGGGRGDVA